MPISIRQIHPVFVGEVSGVDLTRPLAREEVATLEAGMDQYAVLVFPDQRIDNDQQMAFTRYFGAIEPARGGNITRPDQQRLPEGMNDVSNLGQDNKPLAPDDRRRLFNLANQLWHSDSSFRAVPAKYSILSCHLPCSTGGNTEFADMRAAYDALDARTKAEIEHLGAEEIRGLFLEGEYEILQSLHEKRETDAMPTVLSLLQQILYLVQEIADDEEQEEDESTNGTGRGKRAGAVRSPSVRGSWRKR